MTAVDPRSPPLVLVIHNGTSVADLIAYLTLNGIRVEERRNDTDVLTTVATIDPDLIVLDFAVAGDTVQWLKANPRTRDIPVIALAEVQRRPRGDHS